MGKRKGGTVGLENRGGRGGGRLKEEVQHREGRKEGRCRKEGGKG